jgi:hypothetical protein
MRVEIGIIYIINNNNKFLALNIYFLLADSRQLTADEKKTTEV